MNKTEKEFIMKTKLRSLSLVLAVVLVSVGCSNDNASENSEFKDARVLVDSLGAYSAVNKAKNSQTDSLGERAGFSVADDYDFSNPMVVDTKGNIEKGGLFKFVNKEGHDVELESKDENVVIIKVDLNGDGHFSEEEIIVDKFEQKSPPPMPSKHSMYGDDLKTKLETAADDEEILVRIDLVEVNYIYPVEMQTVSSTAGASVDGSGNVTYFYGGKEISKIEMDKIQEKWGANDRRQNLYRAKVNKENIEEFLLANNIAENDSIKNAMESGFGNFQLSLTKQEIKDLADANKDWIFAMTLPGVAVAE